MIDKKAVIAGLICLDVTTYLSAMTEETLSRMLQPSGLVRTGHTRFSPGGSVAHTGLALHRLDVPVQLIGKIGADRVGQVLQDLLRAEGPRLSDDLVIDLTLPTGVTVTINPPGAGPSSRYRPGANDTLYASDLPRRILEDADLFHFGSASLMRSIYRGEGAELVSILQRARRAGLTTSLNFTLPDPTSPAWDADWPAILANTLPFTDLFTLNICELAFFLDRGSFDRACIGSNNKPAEPLPPDQVEALGKEALGYGLKALLVNLGERGIYLRTAPGDRWEKGGRGVAGLEDNWHDRHLWVSANPDQPQGTVGGEGAARAGFIASILRGTSPETALKIAALTSAASVTPADSPTKMTWDSLEARAKSGWSPSRDDLIPYGWVWNPAHGVWEK